MSHADEVSEAWSDFNKATATIHQCKPGKPGFGHENKYGETYQRLVRLGETPPIRLKYRKQN